MSLIRGPQRLGAATLWALAALVGSACGPPSREQARDDIAQVRCDRYAQCGQVGPGQLFSSEDDCLVRVRDEFNARWPEQRCGQGHLNEEAYEACLRRASTLACAGAAQALDQQVFDRECSARQVCVDPDQDGAPPAPASLELYRDEIVRALCNRAAECDQIGPGKTYESYARCLQTRQAEASDFWPEDRCQGRVDEPTFDACRDRASTLACDGLGSIVQGLAFLNACNANQVCP